LFICVSALITYAISYISKGFFVLNRQVIFPHITGAETVVIIIYSFLFLCTRGVKRKGLAYKIFKWDAILSLAAMFAAYYFYMFVGVSPINHVASSMLYDLATTGIAINPVFALLAMQDMEHHEQHH